MKTKNEFANPISERVYKKAASRGISIYELCKRTGHSEGKVSMAKRRENSFGSTKMLYDFAQFLGTSVEYFVSGKESVLDKDKYVQKVLNDCLEYKNKYEDLKKKLNTLITPSSGIKN